MKHDQLLEENRRLKEELTLLKVLNKFPVENETLDKGKEACSSSDQSTETLTKQDIIDVLYGSESSDSFQEGEASEISSSDPEPDMPDYPEPDSPNEITVDSDATTENDSTVEPQSGGVPPRTFKLNYDNCKIFISKHDTQTGKTLKALGYKTKKEDSPIHTHPLAAARRQIATKDTIYFFNKFVEENEVKQPRFLSLFGSVRDEKLMLYLNNGVADPIDFTLYRPEVTVDDKKRLTKKSGEIVGVYDGVMIVDVYENLFQYVEALLSNCTDVVYWTGHSFIGEFGIDAESGWFRKRDQIVWRSDANTPAYKQHAANDWIWKTDHRAGVEWCQIKEYRDSSRVIVMFTKRNSDLLSSQKTHHPSLAPRKILKINPSIYFMKDYLKQELYENMVSWAPERLQKLCSNRIATPVWSELYSYLIERVEDTTRKTYKFTQINSMAKNFCTGNAKYQQIRILFPDETETLKGDTVRVAFAANVQREAEEYLKINNMMSNIFGVHGEQRAKLGQGGVNTFFSIFSFVKYAALMALFVYAWRAYKTRKISDIFNFIKYNCYFRRPEPVHQMNSEFLTKGIDYVMTKLKVQSSSRNKVRAGVHKFYHTRISWAIDSLFKTSKIMIGGFLATGITSLMQSFNSRRTFNCLADDSSYPSLYLGAAAEEIVKQHPLGFVGLAGYEAINYENTFKGRMVRVAIHGLLTLISSENLFLGITTHFLLNVGIQRHNRKFLATTPGNFVDWKRTYYGIKHFDSFELSPIVNVTNVPKSLLWLPARQFAEWPVQETCDILTQTTAIPEEEPTPGPANIHYLCHNVPLYKPRNSNSCKSVCLVARLLKKPPLSPKEQAQNWGLFCHFVDDNVNGCDFNEITWADHYEKWLEKYRDGKRFKLVRALKALETLAEGKSVYYRILKGMVKIDEELPYRLSGFKPRFIGTTDPLVQAVCGPFMLAASRNLKSLCETPFRIKKLDGSFMYLHVVYASSSNDQHLTETYSILEILDENDALLYVAGDDSALFMYLDGSLHGWEFDASSFDQSQSYGVLFHEYTLLHRLGVPKYITKELYKISCANILMVLKEEVTLIRGRDKRPFRVSGGPDTTIGNGLVMISLFYQFFRKETYSSTSFETNFKNWSAKIAGIKLTGGKQSLRSVSFLKGLWYLTDVGYVWGPAPSRILKIGKARNPQQSFNEEDIDVACLCHAASVANSYKNFLQVPLIRSFVKRYKYSLVEPEKIEFWKVQSTGLYNNLKVNELETSRVLSQRYDIDEDEIAQVEAFYAKSQLYQFIEAPLFRKLSIVDYGE